jgi:transposase-like protein
MTQSMLAKCAQKPKPADRGKALIHDWRQSGLSQAAYARHHRIGTHLLTYWSKKFPESGEATAESDTSDQAAEAAPAADFIQLPVTLPPRPTPAPPPHIEIRLASGALVRVAPGVDHELLKVVMQTLVGSTC